MNCTAYEPEECAILCSTRLTLPLVTSRHSFLHLPLLPFPLPFVVVTVAVLRLAFFRILLQPFLRSLACLLRKAVLHHLDQHPMSFHHPRDLLLQMTTPPPVPWYYHCSCRFISPSPSPCTCSLPSVPLNSTAFVSASATSAFPSSVCSGHSGSPSLGVFSYSSAAVFAESGMSAAESSAASFGSASE